MRNSHDMKVLTKYSLRYFWELHYIKVLLTLKKMFCAYFLLGFRIYRVKCEAILAFKDDKVM